MSSTEGRLQKNISKSLDELENEEHWKNEKDTKEENDRKNEDNSPQIKADTKN